MLKKYNKKSWLRNNPPRYECGCFHCTGNWFKRFLLKSRVRKKFFKNIKYEE